MTSTTTRRAVFGAAGLVAAAALTRCGSTPAHAAPSSTEWDRLCRDFHAAAARSRAAMDAYCAAEKRHNSQLGTLGEKPTPPESPPLDTSMSLAALVEQSSAPEWKRQWAEYEGRLAKWEVRRVALKADVLDDADQAWVNADGIATDLVSKIRTYPVTTLAMLSQKASILHEFYDGCLEESEATALVADIHRLAGEA